MFIFFFFFASLTRTEEKPEMPNVFEMFREGRRKCQRGVCGGVAREKINFHYSSLCENRKFLTDYFTDKLFQPVFSYLSLINCLFKIT